MNTQYVVVIEADNKRALAAYLKGLADLDLIWPDLMASAQTKDDAEEAAHRLQDARRKMREEGRAQEIAEYERKMKEWRGWVPAGFFFPGDRPTKPTFPERGGICLDDYWRPSLNIFGEAHRIQRIRDELRRMADVAGAALGPYHMTEHAVGDMIKWESGAMVDHLTRQFLS